MVAAVAIAIAATGCSATRATTRATTESTTVSTTKSAENETANKTTNKPPKSETEATTIKQVERMLAAKLYKIDIDRATPMAAPSMSLPYPYHVSIIGDRVESFLPYFGRAYTLPYGGGEGLRFAAPISDYRETEGRRGRHDIRFRAVTAEDTYDFFLRIFPTGESSLSISPGQKQSISFSGRVDMTPEFETTLISD